LPAKIVGGLLLAMGLAWLTVFVERLLALNRARHASKQFASEVAHDIRRDRLKRAIAAAGRYPRAHLARLVGGGLTTYLRAHEADDGSGLSPAERTRRHLERLLEELGADLRRGLPVLASVGSVAPFVGLLGTALGLAVAIPAVLAFNYLSTVVAGDELALRAAASELLDTIEGWGEPDGAPQPKGLDDAGAREERRGLVA